MKSVTVHPLGSSRGREEGHACTSPCWRTRDGPLGALVPAVRRSKKNASYSSLTCIHHRSMGQEAFQCVYLVVISFFDLCNEV